MILEYGAKNFLSFNEGIEVSFRLNSNCPESISKGKNYNNILCVKGANASGKTNVLKILNFLNKFCCNSFSKKPDEEINCKSFFENNKPIDFYIEFAIDKIEFRYELTLNKKQVINEKLFRKNKRKTRILERKENEIVYYTPDYEDVKIIKLRSNASIISTANQYEIKSLAPIYNFFESIITNIDLDFSKIPNNNDTGILSLISKIYFNSSNYFDFAKKIILKADLGISDLKINKIKDETNNNKYIPTFHHLRNEKDHLLNFFEQSSGTKSLFNQLWIYAKTLEKGGTLVLDEFDINLHPHILPLLIDLFDNENTNGSQIIFTTHNTEIIDYLGKYRVFLVNKENNESFGYRLDEIQGEMLRNDRPISPIYNEGKIGGIPKL